jgi:putative flippase GtrA
MRLISLIKSQAVDKTLIKYFIVGAISFICDLAIFGFFLKVLDFYYLYSATLSFVFATSLNFYLSKNFAFNGLQKFSSIRTFGLIFLASSVGLLINMSFLYIFYEWLFINIFISKILAAGISFIVNYSLRKFVIFKK